MEKAISRFPHLFDFRLQDGYERLLINSSKDFLLSRNFSHISKLLIAQFYLQKKMETSIQQKEKQNPLFLKLFESSSRLCLAIAVLNSYEFQKEKLMKIFSSLVPSINEIPRSSFRWYHPDLAYFFYYFEAHKLRGEKISQKDLRKIENSLREQLLATAHLAPALFWPYNEEESHRQIQLLLREIISKDDLPHVSLHFQEQTSTTLKFLIHLARPKTEPLNKLLKRFPESLDCFCHFQRNLKTPFPIELAVFSLKIPSSTFEFYNSINLLYARRYVLKFLESAIGPFRDYNGGLFEKQQSHFEVIRVHLSNKIPHFDLFAEKVFYALNPVEARLSLNLHDAEDLFILFSELIRENGSFVQKHTKKVTVIKTANSADLQRINAHVPARMVRAQITLGEFHYLCLLGTYNNGTYLSSKVPSFPKKKGERLQLVFQEGAPLSLNPYHSSGDMRCRILSKLLFEGLTRLNVRGSPELAGARDIQISNDGLLYTFKLRSHSWSNGEKVTAIDFVTGWQRAFKDYISHPELLFILKNARPINEKKLDPKKLGIKAIDAETIQVNIEKPDPFFLHKLAEPFFFPLFGSLREPKWFNGPYSVREQNKERLLLEKNPYYWNKKSTFFKQIDIRWNEDVNAIFTLFSEGKVDWIGDPLCTLSSTLIHNLQKENLLQKQEVNRRFIICFNTKHPVLGSSSIRRALSLAIDRSFICETIFPGSSPLPPSNCSLDEARALFEKGLLETGLTKETFPLLTFVYSHQSGRENLALYLQSLWQRVFKIPLRLEKNEWNVFRNKIEKGHFEICGTIQAYEDSPHFLERFEGASSWNFSQWTNSNYRKMIARAHDDKNKKKQQALEEAKKVLLEETPFTPLFTYTHLYACHPQLTKYFFDGEGCVDFSRAVLKRENDEETHAKK